MLTTYLRISPKLKQNLRLKLKPAKKLLAYSIFTLPSRIKTQDINAMFSGVINLMRKQIVEEQNQKYLRLKLKYIELKKLYNRLKPLIKPQVL